MQGLVNRVRETVGPDTDGANIAVVLSAERQVAPWVGSKSVCSVFTSKIIQEQIKDEGIAKTAKIEIKGIENTWLTKAGEKAESEISCEAETEGRHTCVRHSTPDNFELSSEQLRVNPDAKQETRTRKQREGALGGCNKIENKNYVEINV